MANIYVRSTDGSNVDNGSTWALAKATLAGAAAIDAAGDSIWLSQAHDESSAAVQTITLNGTRASPVKVICANDVAEPPTAVSTAARVKTTGGSSITIGASAAGGVNYLYGISFEAGSGNVTATISCSNADGSRTVYESCSFVLTNTGSNSIFPLGSGHNSFVEWRNCTVKFNSTGQTLRISQRGVFRWVGGSFLSGTSSTTTTTSLFGTSNAGTLTLIENVDFSNLASTVNLVENNIGCFVMRNCKLPSSWSGSFIRSADSDGGSRAAMYNCSAGAENYKLWVNTGEGTIRDETTLIRSGGASDGTTPISWKVVSNGSASFNNPLYTDDIVFWCGSTGSSITVDLHILHDSATNLKDDEVWVEARYLGSSAAPLGSVSRDRIANVLTTAADQDSSSASWTTTGMANPNKQKLSVTFTPQMKGFVLLRVALAKASYTMYLCPKVEVGGLANRVQYQMPGSAFNNRFCPGAFVNIMNNTRQEQVPGDSFIIESVSGSSLVQELSNYFMAC